MAIFLLARQCYVSYSMLTFVQGAYISRLPEYVYDFGLKGIVGLAVTDLFAAGLLMESGNPETETAEKEKEKKSDRSADL